MSIIRIALHLHFISASSTSLFLESTFINWSRPGSQQKFDLHTTDTHQELSLSRNFDLKCFEDPQLTNGWRPLISSSTKPARGNDKIQRKNQKSNAVPSISRSRLKDPPIPPSHLCPFCHPLGPVGGCGAVPGGCCPCRGPVGGSQRGPVGIARGPVGVAGGSG